MSRRSRPAPRLRLPLLLPLLALGCHAPGPGGPDAAPDPAAHRVPLPTLAGDWDASLVVDHGDTGIWTVAAVPLFPQYAGEQVVGLDDDGVVHVLVQYSGKWTHYTRGGDGGWLGGLAHGDVDPRVEGAELYVGGELGNVYQLRTYPDGNLDLRRVAAMPGHEVHTLVAGDLDPTVPGAELLVLTRPGHLWRLTADGEHGAFRSEDLGPLPSRVRDAHVLPPAPGAGPDAPPEVATASRDGHVRLLTFEGGAPRWRSVHAVEVGLGRLALGSEPGRDRVLYVSLDDGRVQRLAEDADGTWAVETIYAGPQGPRGLAVGPFGDDPDAEAVAVFGYGARVQLLTRTDDGWRVEDLFEDRDRGHWLAAAELEGRNGTRELLGSGYGGRIFLLSRPPGYALPGVATDPAAGAPSDPPSGR